MNRLRKMLGRTDSPYVVSFRRLLDAQSKPVVAQWCIDYARNQILPIFKKAYPQDDRGDAALNAATLWLVGEVKLPVVRKQILNAHTAAREAAQDPAAAAAMRAVAQSASVVHVVSHALGIVHYGCCALVYDRLGLTESDEVYEDAAARECAKMEDSFRKFIATK